MRNKLFLFVFALILISVGGHALATDFWGRLTNKPAQQTQSLQPTQNRVVGTMPSLAPVIKNIVPAVVNISTKTEVAQRNLMINPFFNDPFFKQFFNFNLPESRLQKSETVSVGSGVIVDSAKGYIITNNHVVDGADEVFVTLFDKRKLPAKLVGSDKETDLALLKIEAENLSQINFGVSKNLEVGDYVIAVGNPFGLGQTVTHGIVSALGRNGLGIEGYEDFIQTDAPINPGNSGGALVDLNGKLIGINTAIVSKSGGSVGIGFAIPADVVKTIMNSLVSGKAIERGQLGINIQDLTPELASALGVKSNQGAVVAGVRSKSAAEDAGLKAGDVVTYFNNNIVSGSADLRNKVAMSKIGEKVSLTIIRDGKTKNIDVEIGKKLTESITTEIEISRLKGAVLESLPDGSKTQGVLVKDVQTGSPAAALGLEEGDVITSVNKQDVSTPADVLKAAKSQKVLLLNIVRGDVAMYIAVQ